MPIRLSSKTTPRLPAETAHRYFHLSFTRKVAIFLPSSCIKPKHSGAPSVPHASKSTNRHAMPAPLPDRSAPYGRRPLPQPSHRRPMPAQCPGRFHRLATTNVRRRAGQCGATQSFRRLSGPIPLRRKATHPTDIGPTSRHRAHPPRRATCYCPAPESSRCSLREAVWLVPTEARHCQNIVS